MFLEDRGSDRLIRGNRSEVVVKKILNGPGMQSAFEPFQIDVDHEDTGVASSEIFVPNV